MIDITTLAIAKTLIQRPSITPNDSECQIFIRQYLEALGFKVITLGEGEVQNLWAIHGKEGPTLGFAGHTDVVPAGNLNDWNSDPFTPTEKDGYLYGRGAADMKGSLAAMLTATARFITKHPNHPGRIAFLITSDEEGPAKQGTAKIVEYLKQHKIPLEYCVVGEPSSHQALGDIIKNGRRGSLGCDLTILGKQGHVAYPHKADNPIHRAMRALSRLTEHVWDKGNDFFPPTLLQISNIHAGTGATNVIPATLTCQFTVRFSNEITPEAIQQQVTKLLTEADCRFHLDWQLNGLPFLTPSGKLLQSAIESIEEISQRTPQLSTDGGTSDGRFIAQMGSEVLELGPSNDTIHSVNECVSIADLDMLSEIYQRILEKVLLN